MVENNRCVIKLFNAFPLLFSGLLVIIISCTPEEQEFIKPIPIASVAAEITTSGFKATWMPLLGARSYILEVASNETFNKESIIQELTTEIQDTFLTVENLKVAQFYYYRVQARLSTGESTDYSNIIEVSTLGMPHPIALTAKEVGASKFTACWKPVKEAKTYKVEVATDIDFSTSLSLQQLVTTDTFIIVKNGLKVDQDYFYRVVAKDEDIESEFSNVIHLTTTQLTQPAITRVSDISKSGFSLQWNTITGATNYNLDIGTDPLFVDSSAYIIQNEVVGEPAFIADGLLANTVYYCRVRANSIHSFSECSEVTIIKTLTLDGTVALPASEIQRNGFKANWQKVASADSYLLEVATDEHFTDYVDSYDPIPAEDTSSWISGLQQNTVYFYRVSIQSSGSQSSPSNIIQLTTTLLSSPKAYAAKNISNNGFTAVWSKVSEAEVYSLEIASNPDFREPTTIDGISDTTYDVQNLIGNQTYYYRVRAEESSNYSTYSNAISQQVIALGKPSNLAASNVTYTSFRASWDIVEEAKYYTVDVATNDQFTDILTNYQETAVNSTSIEVAGLEVSTTYYIRIKAWDDHSPSEYSEILTIVTASVEAPTALQPTEISAYEIRARWMQVSQASEYLLDIATDNAFTSIMPEYESVSVETAYFLAYNLQPATTYYYRVRSIVNSDTSLYSNVISVTTKNNSTIKIPGLIEAEKIAEKKGGNRISSASSSGQYYLGSIGNTDWVEYELDIYTNTTFTVELQVASVNGGGTINIIHNEIIIGSVLVTDTDGGENWATVATDVSLPSGIQNIQFEFISGAGALLNIDWIYIHD
uniref:Fibronectin type III domain-containing protein n=1 Tax=Roseihalotalea indica TaxID=2867963 RepID=A0AA49GSK8_9BACT|nr:fibronectin type III domain-containing protein [Tunicatimonas sp. TK19036]